MKYILSLFIALWSIAAWGQEGGDGFNPSNPGEPGQRYNLTVNVTPTRQAVPHLRGSSNTLWENLFISAPMPTTITSLSVGYRTEIQFPATALSIIPCRQRIRP